MKFKGQTVRSSKKQYSLKQQLGQGGFSVIYTTSDPEIICKVQVLSNPQIFKAYQNEKQALQQLNHKNIILLKDSFQIKQKNQAYGFLMLQNCNSGNAFNILESYGANDVPQKLVLKISYSVACALQYMHKKQISHRDVKLQNVLLNAKGEYKLCDFGSSSRDVITSIDKNNRPDIQQYIQKTTTPLYRCPEQLDLYSGYQIGTKVDVFALGVLIFILCFKKQPFESRLSAINRQLFIPQQTSYSSDLISLIQICFTSNPKQRITATQLKKQILELMDKKVAQLDLNLQRQFDSTLAQILKINNNMLKKSDQVAQTSIFDKIKRIYNQITTETEGWIASFIQDNEEGPQLKYNRSIISKCWEKRYKVQKMYELLFKYSEDYKSKSLVNIKLLILLHNFMRKGPPQSINYDSKFSAHKLSTKIYRNWKMTQRPTDSDDIKRNSYLCLVIRYYSLTLAAKWKLCYENSDLIQGNFSILPFFQSKKEIALLKLPFISDLIKFLQTCVQFHEILATHSYLVDIQRSIILSLIDEEYCCISLVVFLIAAFKQAICYFPEQLDIEKLSQKLRGVERDFEDVFKRISKLFTAAKKLASLFEEENTICLSEKILDYIKKINIREKKKGNFQFRKYINYEKAIQGLKIPLSYQEAVKNPNFLKSLQKKDDLNVIEMNQYKLKKGFEKQAQNSSKSQMVESNQQIDKQSQAFKKNKQNSVFIVQKAQDRASLDTKENDPYANKNNNFMEFTHQNLNKDMTSERKKTQAQKENSFKDFLSIVDEKFTKANETVNQDSCNEAKNQAKPITLSKQNENANFINFSETTKQNKSTELFKKTVPTAIKQTFSPNENAKKIQLFNSFNNIADQESSKISSINSKYYSKDSVFGQPHNIQNQKKQHNFLEFHQIANNQQLAVTKKESPERGQVKLFDKNKQQPKYESQSRDSLYSNISSLSKQVYNSLNKPQNQAKKVELLNFFDDEQERKPQQVRKENNEIVFDNDKDPLNKTSSSGFLIIQNKSAKEIKFKPQNNQKQTQVYPLENHFRTMPSEHSFIDLKGFIVQEVKKNAQQYFIEFSSLKFLRKVGFGHSSEVFKGQWRGRQVAIKRIKDNMSPSNAKQFKREIMTSVKIRHHPNLVTLIGIAEYQNEYYIINQFCNGATLFDFLHESSYEISIEAKISIAKQITKGMLFLHTNDPPIIHRDLKSLNVLLVNKYTGQPEPHIKIADFGLSRDFASTYMTGTLGTYHWMAPQIFNNQPYSLKADVYSFGIVLWQILSRSPPYTNIKNPQSLMKYITIQNGRPDLNLITLDCPYELKALMIKCWDKSPENRPSFKQILQILGNVHAN